MTSLGLSISLGLRTRGGEIYDGLLDTLDPQAIALWAPFPLLSAYTGAHFRLISDGAGTPESDFTVSSFPALFPMRRGAGPLNGSGQSPAEWLTATSGTALEWERIYDQVGDVPMVFPSGGRPAYLPGQFAGLDAMDFNGTATIGPANALAALFEGSDVPMSFVANGHIESFSGTRTLFNFGRASTDTPLFGIRIVNNKWSWIRRDDANGLKTDDASVNATNMPFFAIASFSGIAGEMYVGGAQVAGMGGDLNAGTITFDTFALGARAGTTNNSFFNGLLGFAGVFDVALSAPEAATLYQALVPAVMGTITSGAYTSYIWPHVTHVGGKTRIGYADRQNKQWIAEIDPDTHIATTFLLGNLYGVDDHNACAHNFLSDGRLLVQYTGHNNGTLVRFRLSTDGAIANLGAETTITVNAGPSYSQLIVFGSDSVIAIYRTPTDTWNLRYAAAFTATTDFGAEQPFVDFEGNQSYCWHVHTDANTVRLYGNTHPSGGNTLGLATIDLSAGNGGLLSSGVTDFGYVDGTAAGENSLPSLFSGWSTIYDPGTGWSFGIKDISPDGDSILYYRRQTSDGSQATYRLMTFTGVDRYDPDDWTHTEIAAASAVDAADGFNPGLYFNRATHAATYSIFIVVKNAADKDQLELWEGEDLVNWTKTVIQTAAEGCTLMRPVSPENAVASLSCLYIDGEYTSLEAIDRGIRCWGVAA